MKYKGHTVEWHDDAGTWVGKKGEIVAFVGSSEANVKQQIAHAAKPFEIPAKYAANQAIGQTEDAS